MDYLEHYETSAAKRKNPFVLLKPVLGVLSGMPGQRHFRHALGNCYSPCSIPLFPGHWRTILSGRTKCCRTSLLAHLGVTCANDADTKIRISAPDQTAVEALLHAMDAVDEIFPGVLDYPLSMGKNPRYEEIGSVEIGWRSSDD